MTESDWLSCNDPKKMLEFLQASGRATVRKLLLYVCASTRLVWEHLQPDLMQEAVEAAERCADGAAWEGECGRLLARLYGLFAERREYTHEEWFSAQSRQWGAVWSGAVEAVTRWAGLASLARSSWSLHSAVTGPR